MLLLRYAILASLLLTSARPQTTQGIISGSVVDLYTGKPIEGARVSYNTPVYSLDRSTFSDTKGYFQFPSLSPGAYRLNVRAAKYQSIELHQLELPVAGRIGVTFRLRPLNDVWQAGRFRSVFFPKDDSVLTFFGPDVDTSRSAPFEATKSTRSSLETSISEVVGQSLLRNLPLAGRDAYTLLVIQPGVSADTTTSRGLGYSVNGQRPASSNYLLDGLENNNLLITGPAVSVAPEALQEYRLSTNNFSAEYGNTSGFVANVVTRSGGANFHGLLYFDFENEILAANDFQSNLHGRKRAPLKQLQPGLVISGPIRKQTVFGSLSFEYLRFRSRQDPAKFLLPTAAFIASLDPQSAAGKLLNSYPAPRAASATDPIGPVSIAPESALNLNRYSVMPRVDFSRRQDSQKFFLRGAVAGVDRPDFLWSPYPAFTSPLQQITGSLALGALIPLRPSLTQETRIGWTSDDLHFDRSHPEVPILSSGDAAVLPSSPAFFGFRNRSDSLELTDNLTWSHGSHVMKVGGQILQRRVSGFLSVDQDRYYSFPDIQAFTSSSPSFSLLSLSAQDLQAGHLGVPDFDRRYSLRQFSGFAQDSFQLTPRLVLNYGIRYDHFGAPRNTGSVQDARIAPGSGSTFPDQITNAMSPGRAASGVLAPTRSKVASWAWRTSASGCSFVFCGLSGGHNSKNSRGTAECATEVVMGQRKRL